MLTQKRVLIKHPTGTTILSWNWSMSVEVMAAGTLEAMYLIILMVNWFLLAPISRIGALLIGSLATSLKR